MSDNGDLPKSRLKGTELNIDQEFGHSKSFKNKTGSRKSYYIFLTLLIFIFAMIVLTVVGLLYANFTATKQDGKTCTTKDCLRSATFLVESMNKSIDPCEDFYKFACGNYDNVHRLPKSVLLNDPFYEVHTSMLISIRDVMEKDAVDAEPNAVSKMRLLYHSCMATDEMNAAGLKPLFQILDKIGLPYLGIINENTNRKKDSNLSSILASVKKYLNIDYLFRTHVVLDTEKTIIRIFLVKPKEVYLFRGYKITEKIRKMSSRKIHEILVSVNNSEENKESVDDLKSYAKYFKGVWSEISKSNNSSSLIHELEFEIAQLLTFNNEYSIINEKIHDMDEEFPIVMSIDELQMFTNNITLNTTNTNEPIIDWKQYLTFFFMNLEHVKFELKTALIQINNIGYFEALFKFLGKTRKSQIVNNVWWEVVTALLPFTTNQMRFIQDRFYYETLEIENKPSRSIYCANAVNTMMGMAVSHLLIDWESAKYNKIMVVEMMKNIHWAFEKIVKELQWMDDTTKTRILYKAQQMKTLVGFPEFIKDPAQLDDYYSDYKVENDYFSNIIWYVQRSVNSTLGQPGKSYDYTGNTFNPLVVNALYDVHANSISVPAGILQFHFFGHDLQVLNYGFLGSILGHELTHGFDNIGRQYDHDGSRRLWWTNLTLKEFEKRSNCFIQHYESYVLPEIGEKINGKLTLNEHISDNGGLREALWAYRKFVNDNGEEPKLPGLEEFSSEQLYYLAFANNWCRVTTPESLWSSLSREHSPNYIRMVAALTNSEEFSEVWKCGKGTRMNPKNEKCQIW